MTAEATTRRPVVRRPTSTNASKHAFAHFSSFGPRNSTAANVTLPAQRRNLDLWPVGLASETSRHDFYVVVTGGTGVLVHNVDGPGCADGVPGAASPSLKDLANEVRTAGVHPAAINQRTIAVGIDSDETLFAGSSNGFDAGQRAALERLGIQRVPGSANLHAEEELLRGVPNLERVGTSVRAPCGPDENDCASKLARAGVEVDS